MPNKALRATKPRVKAVLAYLAALLTVAPLL